MPCCRMAPGSPAQRICWCTTAACDFNGSEAEVTTNIQKGSRRGLLVAGLGALLVLLLVTIQFAAAQGTRFNGEITDEHLNCTQSPVKAVGGITKKEACVLYWAHFANPRSKYVLYDAATKTTYQLDDQMGAQPYVGGKVQVTGTLNAATKTIQAFFAAVTTAWRIGSSLSPPSERLMISAP